MFTLVNAFPVAIAILLQFPPNPNNMITPIRVQSVFTSKKRASVRQLKASDQTNNHKSLRDKSESKIDMEEVVAK
jgi:hypothetical protein